MAELVTVYDSAWGDWPLSGHGKGGYLLTYVDGWGGRGEESITPPTSSGPRPSSPWRGASRSPRDR